MNWLISQIINKITYALRVFQFLLLVYIIIDVIYWCLLMGKFSISVYLTSFYTLPINVVKNFASLIKWNIGEKHPMLCPDVFSSIILLIIILVISNFIFVFMGELEKRYVEKSYEKGEKDYD